MHRAGQIRPGFVEIGSGFHRGKVRAQRFHFGLVALTRVPSDLMPALHQIVDDGRGRIKVPRLGLEVNRKRDIRYLLVFLY